CVVRGWCGGLGVLVVLGLAGFPVFPFYLLGRFWAAGRFFWGFFFFVAYFLFIGLGLIFLACFPFGAGFFFTGFW
ncbi:hypothetical protein ACQWFX_24510, partial [Salmonella enterica subsp. enterica serovar Infantis]